MVGIDRRTGKVIENLASAYQGVEVAITTPLSSRVMLREFGGGAWELLGRAITPSLFVAWKQVVATAIDLWEPRFLVRRISASGSVDAIRAGVAGLDIEADYRPLAHLGDFRVERVQQFSLYFIGGAITFQ